MRCAYHHAPPFDTSAAQPTQGRLRYVCCAAYSGRTVSGEHGKAEYFHSLAAKPNLSGELRDEVGLCSQPFQGGLLVFASKGLAVDAVAPRSDGCGCGCRCCSSNSWRRPISVRPDRGREAGVSKGTCSRCMSLQSHVLSARAQKTVRWMWRWPDARQGARRAAVRALQATGNAASRRPAPQTLTVFCARVLKHQFRYSQDLTTP